jgi:predicted Zn-dependent protease
MFEKSNPNSENKRDLAELYYLNGQVTDAVNKLTELKNMTEDPKIKTEIDELIKKYNNIKIEIKK